VHGPRYGTKGIRTSSGPPRQRDLLHKRGLHTQELPIPPGRSRLAIVIAAPHPARSLTPHPAGRPALARLPKRSKKDPDEGYPNHLTKTFVTVPSVQERRKDVFLLRRDNRALGHGRRRLAEAAVAAKTGKKKSKQKQEQGCAQMGIVGASMSAPATFARMHCTVLGRTL